MACSRNLRPLSATLATDVTATQYLFSDEWFLVEAGTSLDFAVNIRDVTGNFTCKPAFQLAAVRPDAPGAPAAITAGSFTGTVGYTMYHETAFVASGHMWCRVGVAMKLSAGTTLGTAQVTVTPYVHGCVEGAGGGEVLVQAGMVSGTDVNYVALTPMMPAVGLSKVMAAIVVTENVSTYLEAQVVVRSCVDPRAPNAWQLAEVSWDNPSATNSERNTGELAVPAACNLTSNTLAQVGVAWRKKAGSAGNPRAAIACNVVVVRG